MKVILTVGHELSGFDRVHGLLVGSGLAQALPSNRDELSVEQLQQKIVMALDVDLTAECVQLKPGKIWQDFAADILIANLEQKAWGFADARTLSLLDFWINVDTQTNFVLVYNSPAQVVASALAQENSAQEIGAILNKWKSDNTELLRFYHRNKDRALLVHANSVSNLAAQAFVQSVNKTFGVSLHDAKQQAVGAEQASELAGLIAEQAILQYADLMDCYHELESVADFPEQTDASNGISVEKASAEFAILKAAYINNKQLQIALKSAHERNEATTQVQEDTQKRNLVLAGDIESLTAERDLITLQLHSVQEELEQLFMAKEQIQQQNTELTLALENASTVSTQLSQSNANLEKANTEKSQEIKQLKEKIIQAEKAVSSNSGVKTAQDKLTKINASLTEENKLMLLQLHQVQEELENYYLKYQALAEGKAPQDAISDSFISSFWKKYQPEEITIDLRTDFLGNNWYEPETNGAWAGPELKSTLKIPALSKGDYTLTLVIADAMDPDIISTMAVSLNGMPLLLTIGKLDYPAVVTATFDTNKLPADSIWEFELTFARNISPADCADDNQDGRYLAIKLQQLSLSSKVAIGVAQNLSVAPEPERVVNTPKPTLNHYVVKMSEPIQGENWHEAEQDGRWAGPNTLSTVIMPGLIPGQYDINLDIVDAIEPEVLAGMDMLINGNPVPLSFDWSQFPTPVTARLSSEQIEPRAEWELSFRFPKTIAPAEQNPANQDQRKLAVRVQSIAFTPV